MIERALIGIPALIAVAAGAILAGGLPALVVAAITASTLAVAIWRPGWPGGPTVVAAGLIVEVAVADERAWWRALVAALLLAAVLATGEIAQTGARHAGWATALAAHWRAGLASAIGIAAVTAAAATSSHDATIAAVLVGIAAAAALLTLLLVQVSART